MIDKISIGAIVFIIVSIFGLTLRGCLNSETKDKCRELGGVYLARNGACVQGVDLND